MRVFWLEHVFPSLIRLRVVPYFSSGIVERAKRERAWKSTHARKGDSRRGERKMRGPSFFSLPATMHYTKKTTINKQSLFRFQKNFFQGSENWNSPSFFRCFAPCPAFLWGEKLSCSFVLPPKNAQTFIGRHFFLHTTDFSLSKFTALKVVWGKDTSRRSKVPGSDLPSFFSAWAPFCKCAWRHHISRSGCGPDWWRFS